MSKTSDNAIVIDQLCLHLGNGAQMRKLLDSISLHINTGERVAIVGPNGAGKTSLLRCLLGLIQTQSGSISLYDQSLAALDRHEIARSLAYVPQQLPDNIPFTVRDFILMSRYSHTRGNGLIPRDHTGEQVTQQVMERIGITHLQQQPLTTLSGGERQKVNIAAALAQQTPILILDEPSSHLDPSQREAVQKILGEIGRKNKTTILTVTHDLNWAAMDFDRIIGMSEGRVVLDENPEKFITTENLKQIFNSNWITHPHPESGLPMVLPSRHSSP